MKYIVFMPNAIERKVRQRAEALLRGGQGPAAVAASLDLPASTVRGWSRQMKAVAAAVAAVAPVPDEAPAPAPPAAAAPAEEATGARVITLREDAALRDLGALSFLRDMARRAGLPEAAILRAALVLGAAHLRKDPAALLSAADTFRG